MVKCVLMDLSLNGLDKTNHLGHIVNVNLPDVECLFAFNLMIAMVSGVVFMVWLTSRLVVMALFSVMHYGSYVALI